MITSRIFAVAALAAFLAPAGARATITPDAQKVIDRYFEAAGGREAWAQKRRVHFTGTIDAYGLKGTIEGWRKAPDKEANEAVIGPFKVNDWSNGNHVTRTDPSGKLVPVDGKELEDAIGGVWFDNDRWLEADQGGGSVSVSKAETDTSQAVTVLEVVPPSGRKALIEFSRKTGLVVRSRTRRDQVDIVATNSDFRTVDGWMTAFKTVQEVPGMAANTVTIQIEHVDFPADIPDDKFAPPAASGSGVTWLKTPGSAHVPFEYIGGHVWLRAAINGGAPADFMLDTGASVSVIDSTYAASIKLATSGSMQAMGGASSAGRASFATLDALRVVSADNDGVEAHGLKVAVINVNSLLQPYFFRPCAGIVGFDIIGQLVTQLDFDHHQVTFFDPATFKYNGKGTALPMTLAGSVPVVNIKVDGAYEGAARVDVGSDAVLDLHTPFVKKNDLLNKVQKTITTTNGGVGGMFQSHLARMKSIELGPYRIDSPLVGLSSTEQGVLASEDYAGNIGNGLLDRFTVTLDYQRRQVWLEPGARYGERDHFTRLGVQFAKMGDDLRVAQVLDGSPAKEAGLQAGDIVTTIDGKPAASLDRDALDRQFEDAKPGSKVKITFTRDGKSQTVTTKLKDIL